MAQEITPETTDSTRDADRIYNLNLELKEAKREKKIATQMHNGEIRRIQAEIDEILNREQVIPDAATDAGTE